MQQPPQGPDPTGSFTIDGWCIHHNCSRGSYYNLKRQGKAPRSYKIGNSERITTEADLEWVAEREAEAASKVLDPKITEARRKAGAIGNEIRLQKRIDQSRKSRRRGSGR